MHVHACRYCDMRTTVELSDEIRAKLLELAARRGERGFSSVVEEALELYFDAEDRRQRQAEAARAILGTMSDDEADDLRASIRRLREQWR